MKSSLTILIALLLISVHFCYHTSHHKKSKSSKHKKFRTEKNIVIKVYLEPLCPDTIRFFRYSLMDFYKHHRSFMNLSLVKDIQFYPGGLTRYSEESNGKVHFSCMHGHKECEANKMFACALNLLPSHKYKEFVFCYMKNIESMNRNNHDVGSICATQVEFHFSEIQRCLNGSLANQHLLNILKARDCLPEKVRNAPWVLFNDQFDRDRENQVERNMIHYTCTHFNINNLEVCKDQDEF